MRNAQWPYARAMMVKALATQPHILDNSQGPQCLHKLSSNSRNFLGLFIAHTDANTHRHRERERESVLVLWQMASPKICILVGFGVEAIL